MSGNVGEWTQDWWDGWDGASDYGEEAVTDPIGAEAGRTRAVRGGDYLFAADYSRVGLRSFDSPGDAAWLVGFRIARTAPTE